MFGAEFEASVKLRISPQRPSLSFSFPTFLFICLSGGLVWGFVSCLTQMKLPEGRKEEQLPSVATHR